MNNSILVITDQDNITTLALDKANEIAKLFRSDVEVVSFIDASQNSVDVISHEKQLKQHVNNSFDDELNVSMQIVVTADLAQWTFNHCQQHDIDLVIKTGHRSETLFYTPTDWQLIRKLNCPLLIASENKWRAKSAVLAAIDAGDNSQTQCKIDKEVLAHARYWADVKDCQLHGVYTMPIPKAKVELDIIDPEVFERDNLPKAQQLLKERLSQCQSKEIVEHIEFGSPEKRIPSYANKIKADLVVLGSVGRTGINGLLLGNTAEKVLRNLRTDILIIKP